jgi:tetratricopeptide (TPR) repeat protein
VERLKGAEAGVKEAAAKIRSGDLDGAIALLQGLLAKDPRNVNALFYLGLGYAGQKKYREAVDALTQVTEIQPGFPGAHFELGVCYRGLGDLEKALESYDRNLKLDPANADSAYNSGLILFETNRIDEALVRFQAGLASRPEDPGLLEMVGRCYINQAKFAAAIEHLEKARSATTDPDKAAFLDQLIRQTKALVR